MKKLWPALVLAACLGPQDDPSQVRDLRVISANFEPPELMAGSCLGLLGAGGSVSPLSLAAFAAPVRMRWLVLDANGQGRDVNWELRTCSNVFDRECDDGDGDSVRLTSGVLPAGQTELVYSASLGTQLLPGDGGVPFYCPGDGGPSFLPGCADGGQPLLFETQRRDTYRGLGGIRVPVVLHLSAGTEHVYAQKLMVYSCRFFDDQRPNVTPAIPGLTVRGADWPASPDGGPTALIEGLEPDIEMTPAEFADREEDYTVTSLELKPVRLRESWKFSWHTSLGRFDPTTSGGTDFTGALGKPRSRWLPRIDGGVAGLTEQDVTFWVVVRDGRGGESWVTRRAHFVP